MPFGSDKERPLSSALVCVQTHIARKYVSGLLALRLLTKEKKEQEEGREEGTKGQVDESAHEFRERHAHVPYSISMVLQMGRVYNMRAAACTAEEIQEAIALICICSIRLEMLFNCVS